MFIPETPSKQTPLHTSSHKQFLPYAHTESKGRTKNTTYNTAYIVAIGIGICAAFLIQLKGVSAQTAVVTTGTTISNTTTLSTADELRKKIELQTKNIEALNKEIQAYSELKDKTTKEAQTLQALINDLNKNAKVLDLDIKKTRSQIEKANLEISSLDINIKRSEGKIGDFKTVLSNNIREIQQREDDGFIVSVLAQRNLSDTLIEINDRMNLGKNIKAQVDSLRSEKQLLSYTKQDEEAKKVELSQFQTELANKKKIVEYNKNEQTKTLSATKNQEKTYQQLLAEKQALKAQFEKELFSYESTLKYTLDPASIPRAGSSALAWPLDKIRINQRFGKTAGAKQLYVSGSHNGVDFQASIGTAVKSAASGTVIGAGDTDATCPRASFGRWVLVKHTNGLASIYAHLSVISAKEGDVVTAGQVIGYSGNTGYSTGPHLHVSVYASNAVEVQNRPSASCNGKVYRMPIAPVDAYLDPMLYFPSA